VSFGIVRRRAADLLADTRDLLADLDAFLTRMLLTGGGWYGTVCSVLTGTGSTSRLAAYYVKLGKCVQKSAWAASPRGTPHLALPSMKLSWLSRQR
jgi:hypothetical protein